MLPAEIVHFRLTFTMKGLNKKQNRKQQIIDDDIHRQEIYLLRFQEC